VFKRKRRLTVGWLGIEFTLGGIFHCLAFVLMLLTLDEFVEYLAFNEIKNAGNLTDKQCQLFEAFAKLSLILGVIASTLFDFFIAILRRGESDC